MLEQMCVVEHMYAGVPAHRAHPGWGAVGCRGASASPGIDEET